MRYGFHPQPFAMLAHLPLCGFVLPYAKKKKTD
jgi:hypothetical protein